MSLEPLRHQEYSIAFRLWPRRPWEVEDERYDKHNEMFPGVYGDAMTKRLHQMKKACREIQERRHLIQKLELGFYTYPLQGSLMAFRDNKLMHGFNLQLNHMLFSDASVNEHTATQMTNLTSFTVYLLPLQIFLRGLKPDELFAVWDPRRRLQDAKISDTRVREALIRTYKVLPTMHSDLYTMIHACTWKLLQTNPKLSNLCVVQLSDDFEDCYSELGPEDQETKFLAPELHNFLASLSQARQLTRLTSLSLIKFDWPRYATTRLLAILRETTPNLEQLTIVFRLYNRLGDLKVEDSLSSGGRPLPVKYLHLSSFNPKIPLSFDHSGTHQTFFEDNNRVKQAFLSLLAQFPLLEELRLTGSDCQGRKESLETRSSLLVTMANLIRTPTEERSQRREAYSPGLWSYFWYSGRGRASATEFCREVQALCPRLKALDFSRYPTFRPTVMQAFLDTYGAQLESLDMFGNPGFDASALVQAVRICTNLTTLDISFCHTSQDILPDAYGTPYAPLYECDSFRNTDSVYECGYESDENKNTDHHLTRAWRPHASIRQAPSNIRPHMFAIRPRHHITGREASLALWKLPHLKRFYAQGIMMDARDLLFEYDIANWDKEPKEQKWRVKMPWGRWACQKLEVLAISIAIPSGSPGFDDRDDFIRQDILDKEDRQKQRKGSDKEKEEEEEEGKEEKEKKEERRDGQPSPAKKQKGSPKRRGKGNSGAIRRLHGESDLKSVTAKEVRQSYEFRVCEQLGQLTRLRELLLDGMEETFGVPARETMHSLTLTVDTGLKLFAPLAHSLERLCVTKLTDKLAGKDEVEWIANNLYYTSLDPKTVAGRLQRHHQQTRPEPTRTNFVELLGLSRNTLDSPREVHRNLAWLRGKCPGLRVELVPLEEDQRNKYSSSFQDY
ncbi:hypothetical protein DFQ26_005966 [Actinomortierella ambigua]|nr:hypothetical protein DFQ26_005966 [Actinomortierella ambigua]